MRLKICNNRMRWKGAKQGEMYLSLVEHFVETSKLVEFLLLAGL